MCAPLHSFKSPPATHFNGNPLICIYLYLFSSCDSHYVGDYCEHRNPCNSMRCQNGGTCQVTFRNGRPGISCKCPLGFDESLCEIAVPNACDHVTCHNGGTCQLKTLQEYTCACANGYTGEVSNPPTIY